MLKRNQILLGNALEVMENMIDKNLQVDCIVVDPPYKVISGGKPKHKGQPSGILSKNDGKIFEHNDLKEEDWFPLIFELLKENSHCYIMVNTLNLERYLTLARNTGFKLHNILVWEKNNCTPNRWYMKNAEYVLFLRKGKAKPINILGSKTIHQVNNITNKLHPSQKPVELMELYIKNSTKEGDVVLDFAVGSGTTVVACQNTNRIGIGIEYDVNYFKVAKKRIKKNRKRLLKTNIHN